MLGRRPSDFKLTNWQPLSPGQLASCEIQTPENAREGAWVRRHGEGGKSLKQTGNN